MMKLNIILEDENKQGIINLKHFIDNAGIEGMEQTEIERAAHGDGQMGAGGIISSIGALIEAAEKPLTELVKCLQKYVNNYRTTIRIPDANGNDIVIEHGRSMSPEQLKELITSIQKNQ